MNSRRRFTGFNFHPKIEGTHAFLSPSSPSWLRYDEDKLLERLRNARAAALGTELHEIAARNIKRRIRLHPDSDHPYLAEYVNDAIDFGMKPEQELFYSGNCYGTADAIGFDETEMFLRIHDLKTGVSKPTVDQLYVYAAIFCLEYDFKPFDIFGELRIYQRKEIQHWPIDRLYLAQVYSQIRNSDEIVQEWRMGGSV